MNKYNTFGRNEADKTIENTINRDYKTSGGYIGFSSNFSATQRWVLNDARRGHFRRLFREQIGVRCLKRTSVIKNEQVWLHHYKESTPFKIQERMKAWFECMQFIKNRCSSEPEKDFFDLLTKVKRQTF